MAELIILDPDEIAEDRVEVDITPVIKVEGPDWGDADIEAYMASASIGESPVDYRLPNRKVKIPFSLRDVDEVTYEDIRSQVQQKAALFQRESGWLKRDMDGIPLFADVENAVLHLGGDWMATYGGADIDATLELECLPDFYGNVETLDMVAGTATITQVLQSGGADANLDGHYPGRVQMLVADTAGADRHGLIWGVRSRYYSSATTAALAIEAESMTVPVGGTITTRTGASGGVSNNVVRNTLGTAVWADQVVTDLTVGGALTHRGSYRVWARTYSSSTSQSVRFLWSVGELASPVTNATVTIPLANDFALIDLGEVRLDINPLGGHKWTGHVQAKGSGTLDIDQLLFQPLDEAAGQLIGYEASLEPGQIAPAVIYAARDCLLSTNGMFTMTSGGDGYMSMSEVYGDLPRLPTSGLEARPIELFVRATRGDLDTQPDTNGASDTVTVAVTVRPSYLFRP